MGKRSVFFYVALLLFTGLLVSGAPITGEVITGEATSNTAGMSVIITGGPFIGIIHPKNETYLTLSVFLDYLATSGTTVNYSIDGGSETFVSGATNITVSEGTRQLEMWSNNSFGTSYDEVYFSVNTSLLTINYSNYNGSTKGLSTKFYNYSFEELQVLNRTTFENTDYGKIIFNESIDVDDDLDNTDRYVDIDSNVILASSSVTVNSTALPNFNKSATVYFYNLTYSNPQILLDGSECPSDICTIQSYTGGTLIFTVTHFSTYSVIETNVTSDPEPEQSGGGGGGGGSATYHNLDIITPGIIEVGANDELVVPIIVHNPENIYMRNIHLNASSEDFGIDPIFEDNLIEELGPGENVTVMMFIASADVDVGRYRVEIMANVESPKFIESETLYVQTVEVVGKVEVLERILLAQELFKENPECLELTDLLNQAQKLLGEERVSDAKTLVQEAIARCRDLVTSQEFPNPPDFSKFNEWRTPIEISLVLIILVLIILSLLRGKKFDLKKKAKEKKPGFFKRLFSKKKKRSSSNVRRGRARSNSNGLDI